MRSNPRRIRTQNRVHIKEEKERKIVTSDSFFSRKTLIMPYFLRFTLLDPLRAAIRYPSA